MPDLSWDLQAHIAAVYRKSGYLHGIAEAELNAKPLESFVGLEKEIQLLCANTEAFLRQSLGVNALLWGARGSGKSSLILALLLRYHKENLRILQINKEFLEILPEIFDALRTKAYAFIIFCDEIRTVFLKVSILSTIFCEFEEIMRSKFSVQFKIYLIVKSRIFESVINNL